MAAYRDGNVLRWLGAYTASILGDSLYFLALAWAAAQVGRPAEVGVVLAVGAVPRAVLMLAGGVVADRLGPRRVVIASDTIRATVVLAVAVALFLSSPGVWLLIVLALVFGRGRTALLPGYRGGHRRLGAISGVFRVRRRRNARRVHRGPDPGATNGRHDG